jgi:hypothetical protein
MGEHLDDQSIRSWVESRHDVWTGYVILPRPDIMSTFNPATNTLIIKVLTHTYQQMSMGPWRVGSATGRY